MRLQSSHPVEDRGADAYFTPPEAIKAFIGVEGDVMPMTVWEPACGDGAIARPLRDSGRIVVASDLHDYGYRPSAPGVDYLKTSLQPVRAIVTNPPYGLAARFVEKAVDEVPYAAFLLRTNFLESVSRLPFFRRSPPARVWISSRRLPMMHRQGWTGPRVASNTCYAWFVWDGRTESTRLDWFDWKEHV